MLIHAEREKWNSRSNQKIGLQRERATAFFFFFKKKAASLVSGVL